jgi:rubrerythrin
MHEWTHLPERRWACARCGEIVEGPFEQCWNCGAMRTDPA